MSFFAMTVGVEDCGPQYSHTASCGYLSSAVYALASAGTSAYCRPIGMINRKDAYLSPAARRFIEILKKTAKDIAADSR